MECMNSHDGRCSGELNTRYSQMGTKNVRCDYHQAKRDKVEESIRELESPTPAAWFDPADAGERWSDDY